jgi:hemerythrin
MALDKFDWLESFELGITDVDEDHRGMLAIMKKIERAADNEAYDLCNELLEELLEFTSAHFKREEKMLEDVGYPNVQHHREYHTELLARAKAVMNVCRDIKSKDNLKECCHEMFSFLVDDVVTGDLKFKSYMEEMGLIKRP